MNKDDRAKLFEERRKIVEALAWRIYCETVGQDPKTGKFADIPPFMQNGMMEDALKEAGIM